jgi:hypothetical protein
MKEVMNDSTKIYGVKDKKTGKFVDVGTLKDCEESIERKKIIPKIRESYDLIKELLRKYIDMKEDYYSLMAIWIVGTHLHHEFESYPYLFLNAMRGSGKSRTLKLVTTLSKDGTFLASPTEAVLFRTNGTLGIDEFESIGSKEKSSLRELLNAGYKKGIKIMRMRKVRKTGGEKQEVEVFEPYRPIVMANIWGMEEVLEDRCITLILEKSSNPVITRLVEDFENNYLIKKCHNLLNQCSLCSVVTAKNIYKEWNNYIIDRYKTTLNTLNTTKTYNTLTTQELQSLFNKIHDSGIQGRNLELFLPIFFIANIINEDVFSEIIEISKAITKEKKHEEEIESKDVMVFDFISHQESSLNYHSVNQLTNEFREFIGASSNDDWLNAKWFGRALKRLNLVIDKRRRGKGNEVSLNVNKAIDKLKIFKEVENDPI